MLFASRAKASPAKPSSAAKATPWNALHVRIARHFRRRTGVRHSSIARRADALRIFPEGSAAVAIVARLPCGPALCQFSLAHLHVERAGDGIDLDDVAVLQQTDGAAECRLRADMADAETARSARKPSVGDQRHLF